MSQYSEVKKLWGRGLRELRERHGWKQKELADKAGVSTRQIQRVENGESVVSEGCCRRIAAVLGTTLDKVLESVVSLWNVPRSRNPFFTGREEVIAQLRHWLTVDSVTLNQTPRPLGFERSEIPYHWSAAICGLGGVGKTQIAVEYAYQYRQDYKAVLWTQADSSDDLVSGFVAMANLLHLPQKNASDQKFVVSAVKGWFESTTGWLLIFDNADTPELLEPFMPCNPRPEHPDTAQSLAAVGKLFFLRRKCFDKAEQLFKRALTIHENCFGTNHPNTVAVLEDLGGLYLERMKFHEAEQCFQQVLTIRQHALGPEHPDTGQVFSLLGVLYRKQGKIIEAERNYERALSIRRKTLGSENPFTAMAARGLAQIYKKQVRRLPHS